MRIAKGNANINGYVSFRQSGNRGVEYYPILGDPNALRFRGGAGVKIVLPLDKALGHAPGGPGEPPSRRKRP